MVRSQANDVIVRQPSPAEILDAVRRHQRAFRARFRDEEGPSLGRGAPPSQIARVSFIEDRPTAVWVGVRVNEDRETGSWEVPDPFGQGSSPRLLQRIERAAAQDEHLQRRLDELRNKLSREDGDRLADIVVAYTREAQEKVREAFPGIEHGDARLFEHMTTMERIALELEALGRRAPHDRLHQCVLEGTKGLERLFQLMHERFRSEVWRSLSDHDAEFNRQRIEGAARAVGFSEVPSAVLKVRKNKVRSAIEHAQESLRPWMAASVLVAACHTAHPLRALATERPAVLCQIDRLARVRGEGAHANDQRIEFDQRGEVFDALREVATAMWESLQKGAET